jgi:hypothetical protein
VRGIKPADNLVAQVEGNIEDVDGVMRITKIRLRYRFQVPAGGREKVVRLLASLRRAMPGLPVRQGLHRVFLGGRHRGTVAVEGVKR